MAGRRPLEDRRPCGLRPSRPRSGPPATVTSAGSAREVPCDHWHGPADRPLDLGQLHDVVVPDTPLTHLVTSSFPRSPTASWALTTPGPSSPPSRTAMTLSPCQWSAPIGPRHPQATSQPSRLLWPPTRAARYRGHPIGKLYRFLLACTHGRGGRPYWRGPSGS